METKEDLISEAEERFTRAILAASSAFNKACADAENERAKVYTQCGMKRTRRSDEAVVAFSGLPGKKTKKSDGNNTMNEISNATPLRSTTNEISNATPLRCTQNDIQSNNTYNTINTMSTQATAYSNYTNTTNPKDLLYRPEPLPALALVPLTNVRNGLNGGSMDERQISSYQGKKNNNDKAPVWPERPPMPKGRLGANMAEKRWRVDIAFDGLAFLQSRDWINWQPRRLNVRYEIPENFNLPASQTMYETQISISAEDSFGVALRLIHDNPMPQNVTELADIPAVLNMAHWSHAGGGFLLGARAQEEDLCRRSDLFMALQYAEYPLPEFGANYTFPVSIIRDSKHTNYRFLKTSAAHPTYFPQVAVLSAAAYKDPKVGQFWRTKMRRKVSGLLTAALASGHRILILCAWGCGAFNNPPEEVSTLFKEALQSAKFKGRFKQVIFAMGTRRNDANLDNLSQCFLKTFGLKMFRPRSSIDLDKAPHEEMLSSCGSSASLESYDL